VFVFIDESGDLGRFGSKFFVIACLITNNRVQLERIVKRIRQRLLHKHEKEVPEIKANSSSRLVREKVLEMVSRTDASIAIIAFEKKGQDLRLKSNELYNQLVGSLLMEINFSLNTRIEIIIDKKDSNQLLRKNLDAQIIKALGGLVEGIKIRHMDSFNSKGLQVVDFVAWAANRKFSFDDNSYYKIIENKINLVKKE